MIAVGIFNMASISQGRLDRTFKHLLYETIAGLSVRFQSWPLRRNYVEKLRQEIKRLVAAQVDRQRTLPVASVASVMRRHP
jgi:hypothetical protein